MQQQGSKNGSQLNPNAAEFYPLKLTLGSRPGLQSDQRHQSLAVPTASEAGSGRGTSRNSNYPPNYPLPDDERDCPTESLYNRLNSFYMSRPNDQDLEYISKLCTDLRNQGLLTSGLKNFFQEVFTHLSWVSKPFSGGDRSGVGATLARFGSTSDILDLTNPYSVNLKLVIVHFAGAIKESILYPENLMVECQDGAVRANRDVLVMNSGYFYQKCLWNSGVVKLTFCTSHQMTSVKTLLLKGRVVVLKKRVPAFLRLVGLLQIRGVFPSEDCNLGQNEERYFSEVFDSPSILEMTPVFSPDFCQPMNTVPGAREQVRCLECRIVFEKGMFLPHYEEYHAVLPVHIQCCTFYFRTKYAYVHHKNTACTKTQHETDCTNISVIRPHEQSGVSVNLAAVRPSLTTHSTPNDDRV